LHNRDRSALRRHELPDGREEKFWSTRNGRWAWMRLPGVAFRIGSGSLAIRPGRRCRPYRWRGSAIRVLRGETGRQAWPGTGNARSRRQAGIGTPSGCGARLRARWAGACRACGRGVLR